MIANKIIEQAIETPARPASGPRPQYQYLSDWPALEPRLCEALAGNQCGKKLDVDKLLNHISVAKLPNVLPFESRRIWGESLQIIDDRSPSGTLPTMQCFKKILPGYFQKRH